MNVLSSLAVLGLLVLFHESGHFLAAKSQGILVNGFSIGFGPAIFKRKFKGVTYALRVLPLGGFVSFPDDDQETEIAEDDPNLLKNRPILQRAIVISAGVIANLLLAWLVLVGQGSFAGLPNQPDPGVLVVSVQEEQAAAKAGLNTGDKVIRIDGIELGRGQEALQAFVEIIKNTPDKSIDIESFRDGEKILLNIKPSNVEGTGRIGAQLQPNINLSLRPAKNLGEIFSNANSQFLDLFNQTVTGYKGLITDFGSTAKQLSGPVKIVEIGAQLSEQGGSGLVLFAALVSINLAVLNSLPLPLLDGGQLALLLIEGVRGQPIPPKLQIAFMQSGLLLIIGLSLVLIIRDTAQLSLVQQLISR